MQVHGLALFGLGPGIGYLAKARRNVLVSGTKGLVSDTLADNMHDFPHNILAELPELPER